VSARRHASATAAAVIVAGGIIVTSAYFLLRTSIQSRSGAEDLDGLSAGVDVSYDAWAIPAIVGQSELDVIRAQGFVHAAERLWQMELFQRIARGRLAAIFGEAAVDTDRLIRTLDLWGASGSALRVLEPRERRLLEAYSEGVNARVRSWRGPLPPEFLILGIEPEPWSAQASLAIARIMSLDLSGWQTELERIGTLARLPERLHADLAQTYPAWAPTIMQDQVTADLALTTPEDGTPGRATMSARMGRGAPGDPRGPSRAGPSDPDDVTYRWDPLQTLASFALNASNSWAVGGSRTADGHPLLANDMHLSLRAPSTWFVNGLHARADSLHVLGFSIPGAPGVVVGLNRTLAWGFTNAMLDDGDFIVESLNLDGSMYRLGDEWYPFDTTTESIDVRGGEPIDHVVRRTARGPVVTDVLPSAGLTLSLLWTGLERRGAATALFRMDRSRTAEEFRSALGSFQSPHQNVIYATADGELGYRLVGSIPHRDGVDGSGPISFELLPEGWSGFVPVDSMPDLRRPSTDYLASANNLQVRSVFGVVSTRYPLPFRARRIDDVLSGAQGWTVADMVALQLDTHSLWAERLLPRAIDAARRIGETHTADSLEGWDLEVAVDSPEAAWFYVWLFGLRARIAADELNGDGVFSKLALDRILEAGGSEWTDDVRTPARETLESLEEEAMRAAIQLTAGQSWGQLHQERSVHPMGQVALLDRLFRFNTGPYPSPGGPHTVRVDDPYRWDALDDASWTPPFMNEYGPSERFVAHMDPAGPTGHFFLPTGQAGNPLDRHYRSMTPYWVEGRMVEVAVDPDVQLARETSRLRLRPPR